MKKYKIISIGFILIAVVLSNIMSATVAYKFCYIKYTNEMYSAPPSVAYYFAIPYMIGILICILFAIVSYKKFKKN
jgi:hypothetical protein